MPAPFSAGVMEHFDHPRNVGKLNAPCGIGSATSIHGPDVRVYLRVDDGVVSVARFLSYGCVPAIASASWVTEWAVGRTVDEVASLTAGDIVAALGGLPKERLFCARLALDALHRALLDAQKGAVQ